MSAAAEKCCPTCHQPLLPPHGITVDGTIIRFRGQETRVTRTEAAMFRILLQRIGQTVMAQAIHNHLYGLDPGGGPDMKIISVMCYKLRRRIHPLGLWITSLWGGSYRLEDPNNNQNPNGKLCLTAGEVAKIEFRREHLLHQ